MFIIHYWNISMLDPRLLKAFVAIAEHGSFTSAATVLHMTQSTISQQLARLERAVGRALIDRAARPVSPTPAGERLLGHARHILALQAEATELLAVSAGSRTVRIGVPEDILTPAMAGVFAGYSASNREIRLDVTTGLSRDLARGYRNGKFDVIVVKEHQADTDSRASFVEPMAWFESASTARDWSDPIPLVTFPPGALYRDEMFERIEREKRHWYVGFTGNSLPSVLVAVAAGMGVSLLPRLSVQGQDIRVYRALGGELPMRVSLYALEIPGNIDPLVASMIELLADRNARAARS